MRLIAAASSLQSPPPLRLPFAPLKTSLSTSGQTVGRAVSRLKGLVWSPSIPVARWRFSRPGSHARCAGSRSLPTVLFGEHGARASARRDAMPRVSGVRARLGHLPAAGGHDRPLRVRMSIPSGALVERTPCPRCHKSNEVVEVGQSLLATRWFICHVCLKIFSVPPAPRTKH
jgi:hypothetical protein